MAQIRIPFNKACLTGNESPYMLQAVAQGHISGNGSFTAKAHALLEKVLGVKKVLLTTSCTHALELTALLLNLREGDEVIVPSFTFVSTVNAFVLRGVRPVFIDVRADTLNMDERQLPGLMTPRTRAIVPVHYGGVACEMDAIMQTAQQHGVPVVEDNAHGVFAKYKGRYLGTIGSLATLSFHETKNFTCGEGGALLINDEQFATRAEIIWEKGTNRARFFRGEIDKYTWVDIGSSYLPSDILAAFLLAQLESAAIIQSRRKAIWDRYNTALADWTLEGGISRPFVPAHCEQGYYLFYILMPSLETRQALISHLKARGILSVFHYLPLHLSDMGQKFGGKKGDCPVTEDVSDRLLRLPFYNSLTESEQDSVIEGVRCFVV